MEIWKYPIDEDYQSIMMPKGAKIVDVQIQGESPVIWAIVDEKAKLEQRCFALYMTGERLFEKEGKLEYIGTVQWLNEVYGMVYVYHLFEVV